MSVLLAIAFLLVIILAEIVRAKKRAPASKPVIVQRYVHPGHTWLRKTEDGDVLVGVDDFAQSVIGRVDEVKLPRLLHHVKQGVPGWKVRHNERWVQLVSPVSGWVTQTNEMVRINPSLLNTSPYGDGWLIRVRPFRLGEQLQNLFTGKAIQRWQDAARAQLNRMFSGVPALMYQDGGTLLMDICDRCSDEEWKAIEHELFLSDYNQNAH
jgi:glycine cleavage system H protein